MADETRKGPEKYQSSRQSVQCVLQEQASLETIKAAQFGPDHLEAQGCRMTLQTQQPEARQAQPSQPGQAPPQPSQPVQKK